MRKRFKKLKRSLALALALTVAGTTNLGGLENVVQIKASWEACKYTDSKGVDWKVLFDNYDDKGNPVGCRAVIANPLSLENVDIEIPTSINGYKIETFGGFDSSYSLCKAKSIKIPEGVNIQSGSLSNCAFSNCTFDTMYVNCNEFKIYNAKGCSVKDIIFDGTEKITMSNTLLENLSSVTIKNTDKIVIGENTFDGCQSLNTLNIENSAKYVIIGDQAFNSCTGLKDITIDSEVLLNQAAFANCTGLRNVTFKRDVKINALQVRFERGQVFANTRNLGGVFHNSFHKEYDENGKLVKKTLTFEGVVTSISNGSAVSFYPNGSYMESTGDFNDCDTYVIDNCPGLTDVIFKEDAYLTDNFFFNCASLSNIEFNNLAQLGNKMFENIPVEKLIFNGQVQSVPTKDVGNIKTHNIDTNPFDKCQAKTLIFNNNLFAFTIANMPNLETLFFGGTNVGYEGRNASWGIKLKDCDYLKTIIVYPDTSSVDYFMEKDKLNEMLSYFEVDLDNNSPTVYGYEFKDAVDNYVKTWARKTGLPFENIIAKMKVEYNDNKAIIGDNLTRSDIDTSKITVTAEFPYHVAKFFESIDLPKYNFKDGTQDVPLANNIENTGFIIENIPEKLDEGKNTFYISYSGINEAGTINTEKIKVNSMEVDWNNTKISDLVANQPITAATVVSGATIFYNNGTTDTVSPEALVLDKTITTLGDNIFTVSLKENQDIKESKNFSIKENYITSIKAEYPSDKTLYVGDEIDISKIKLTPVYKYDADNTVNRNITATNCETELKEAGANILKVYYNDIEITMVVSAAAVAPTKLYAMFDTNYTYVEGQKSIDPKSIVTKIEYNNGTSKTIASEEITYEIIQQTSSELQVKVSYAGLESVVTIPVTPKQIVAIKAKANIASATEGTILPKAIIDQIEVTYNNGNTETLAATDINYDEMTFNDYAIVADIQNVITVNYLGKSTEITVVGISNAITNIYAEYIGSGQIVGTEVPVSDVAVHAINSNGQVTDVTTGVLLENAIPYNVGNNTVTVHYGSLSCSITVLGLPAPEVPSGTPGATADVTDKEPVKTEVPVNTLAPTDKPEVPSGTPSAAPTVPAPVNSPVVTVSTPDNANSAPIAANTTVTLKASNAKIAAATTDTYKVYTNKNVVIEIAAVAASNIKYQIVAKGAKVSDTAWKDVTENKITVSKTAKPSIVYIQYKDASGAVQTIHTNGFTVDMKKATVNIKQNKTYKLGKKLTFKDASGIRSAKLDGKKIKSGVKVKKKGLHILVVTDKAGNQTVIKFKIK